MIRIMLMNELHILHCLTMIWWLLGTYLRITACGHHTWSGVCARSDMDMSMCKHDSRREKHAANRGPGGPGAWVQSHKCWSWCSQFMSILGFVTSLSVCAVCCLSLATSPFWERPAADGERNELPSPTCGRGDYQKWEAGGWSMTSLTAFQETCACCVFNVNRRIFEDVCRRWVLNNWTSSLWFSIHDSFMRGTLSMVSC